MTLIAIDFSITSIGVTIETDNKLLFGAFVNSRVLKSTGIEKKILSTLDFHGIFHRNPNSINKSAKNKFIELNRWHSDNQTSSRIIATMVFDAIKKYLGSDTTVVFENYLTARSGGDNTIQTIEYTKCLKDMIATLVPDSKINIVTAPEAKMVAGNGNFTKKSMVLAFIKKDITHKLHSFVSEHSSSIIKTEKTIAYPVADIVDSYFVAQAFKLKNGKQ